MKIVVYTARFGDTDVLRAPDAIDPRVQYLCFSDAPDVVAPYELIRMPRAENPRMAARRVKILADHPLLRSARVTIWHDASYAWKTSPRFFCGLSDGAPIFALHHPRRFKVEQEAIAIARYGYVPLDVAQAYVAAYRADGFTADVLTASGLLGRRASACTDAFNAYWWAEVQRWNGRDQASIDYAAWKAGVSILHLPGAIKGNPYAQWRSDEAVPA